MFFRPDQIKQIQSAGWGVNQLQQNTDLFVQAWHWESQRASGAIPQVGDISRRFDTYAGAIRHSVWLSLRHRGFTRNGGTEY